MNKYKKYSSALRTIPTVDYKDLLIKDKSGKLKKINPLEVKYNGSSFGLILDLYNSELEKCLKLQEDINNASQALIDTLGALGYNTPNVELNALIQDIRHLHVLIPNHSYVNYVLDDNGYIVDVENVGKVLEEGTQVPSDIKNGYYYLDSDNLIVKDEQKYNEYWGSIL